MKKGDFKMSRKTIDIVQTKQIKVNRLNMGDYGTTVRKPEDAAQILFTYLEGVDREYFVVMCLDTKNQVNRIETVSIGSLNASIVHPREIFKTAILANSSSIILGHNHPSGETTPSREDIEVTQRIVAAGEIMGIEILDHIIIGDDRRFYSLKEKGNI
jgi:DNA repair protein RadC